ncbi:hypothetical protein C2G38_815790 [Gigaspora rosea]|uniref:Gamma-butyrobetaine hydroxylase-like N-terminal domain-containing protein n=1 Tax=Gigaspora rosea TaxID=44941 RepID=A0A397U240_9GLOM|nr:hypothetical protein C2G38_815790 [Gigaspora rosea]
MHYKHLKCIGISNATFNSFKKIKTYQLHLLNLKNINNRQNFSLLRPVRNQYTKSIKFLFHSAAHRFNKHLIKEIKQNQNSLEIKWSSSDHKAISIFNYIWLRDNCQCSQCLHPDNRQKLFLTSQVALDVKPISVNFSEEQEELEITWPSSSTSEVKSSNSSDNSFHKSKYPFTFLRFYTSKNTACHLRFSDQKHITWDRDSIKSSKNLWVSYNDYMNSDEGIFDSLEQLWNYGLIFLKNVPIEKDSITKVDPIRKVVERIGNLKATFYGELFDVKSVPGAKNIAYTSLDLGLHMDLLQVLYEIIMINFNI